MEYNKSEKTGEVTQILPRNVLVQIYSNTVLGKSDVFPSSPAFIVNIPGKSDLTNITVEITWYILHFDMVYTMASIAKICIGLTHFLGLLICHDYAAQLVSQLD